MKALSVGGVVVVAITAALAPAVATIYRDIFPAEPVRRTALAACERLDPSFSRVMAAERAKCYAQFLQPALEKPPLVPRHREIVSAGTMPAL